MLVGDHNSARMTTNETIVSQCGFGMWCYRKLPAAVIDWIFYGLHINMLWGMVEHAKNVLLWVVIFTRGQFWPSGIVVACVCVSVCPSIMCLSER